MYWTWMMTGVGCLGADCDVRDDVHKACIAAV